jgi:hypothetical protein
MPKAKKEIRDMEEAQAAASRVLRHIIRETESPSAPDTRNAAAVALGKLGASKGGRARAAVLTKKRRKEIAKMAASARWESTNRE